jgi:phage gp36-like protein
MTYATQADLVIAFGEQTLIDLTDLVDPPTGEIDSGSVDRALADSVAEMDGYLCVKYVTPVTAQPDRLRAVCCDLARYRLCGDRVTEVVRTRYEDAVRWLRDIAAGRTQLVGAVVPAGGAPDAQFSQVAPSRKVFRGGLL